MSLDSWHGWLLIASVIVIIGVVLEGEEIWKEVRAKKWHPLSPKIGFALLVIGLAGEVFFQTEIESMDAKIKRESDIKVAMLTHETEELRAKNLELMAKFAWRDLTREQQVKIGEAVKSFQGSPFDTSISNEPEALNLLNQIIVAVDMGGWVKKHCNCGGASLRDGAGRATSVTLLGTGVDIWYAASKEADFGAPARVLAKALNDNGIEARVAPADVTGDNIHIRVASKLR